MSYSEPVRTTGVSLIVEPISAAEHLAFVRTQRSVSFLQTPAWGRVKTEWRSESLGWFDGRRLVGAGLVLHRPVPRFDRFTLPYLAEGPVIDWTGEIDEWLDPLAAHLKTHGAFAIRLGPPVCTQTWSAIQVKEAIADPGIKRLPEVPSQWDDPVGARVTGQLRDAGWLPRDPRDGFGVGHPQFKYEVPLAGRTEDDLLRGMNQLWRRNIKKAARGGVEVTVGEFVEQDTAVSAGDDGDLNRVRVPRKRPSSYASRAGPSMSAGRTNCTSCSSTVASKRSSHVVGRDVSGRAGGNAAARRPACRSRVRLRQAVRRWAPG